MSPRSDWTAEKDDGVCITLWKEEIAFKEGHPWIDTKVHCQPIEIWGDKQGNKKRIQHLKKAMSDFDGFVDLIIVEGIPGEGVEKANPWLPDNRKGYRWQVTEFDESTGHFEAKIVETN